MTHATIQITDVMLLQHLLLLPEGYTLLDARKNQRGDLEIDVASEGDLALKDTKYRGETGLPLATPVYRRTDNGAVELVEIY